MRVTFKNHPDDMKMIAFAAERQKEILTAAGAKKIWFDPTSIVEQTFSVHLMGTCRMGDDPATSVVDRWGFSHEAPNLGVLGASVMGTSGARNPTLTVQALAWRTAERLIKGWKG